MTKQQRDIINAKKKVFHGFCLKWDKDIEHRFLDECARRPDADQEIIMDRLTHDKIQERFDEFYG